jgi:hypothetical protein
MGSSSNMCILLFSFYCEDNSRFLDDSEKLSKNDGGVVSAIELLQTVVLSDYALSNKPGSKMF